MKKVIILSIILLLLILQLTVAESGFRELPWGASPSEIIEAEEHNSATQGDYLISARDEIYGMRTLVIFHYLDAGLYKGEYEIFASVLDPDGIKLKYNQIKTELDKQYADPDEEFESYDSYKGYVWCDDESFVRLLMEFERGYQINIEHVQINKAVNSECKKDN